MPLITISYNIGCDGDAIARRVANGLDLDLFDNTRLQNMALELGAAAPQIMDSGENRSGFFYHLLSKKPQLYFDAMEAVIKKIASALHPPKSRPVIWRTSSSRRNFSPHPPRR